LYVAETWTLRNVDQKYPESFEMWCWRRIEKISWTDRVKMKYRAQSKTAVSYIQQTERRLNELITSYVGTVTLTRY
jgi:hypothetical protein